jgi:hypothetical protein
MVIGFTPILATTVADTICAAIFTTTSPNPPVAALWRTANRLPAAIGPRMDCIEAASEPRNGLLAESQTTTILHVTRSRKIRVEIRTSDYASRAETSPAQERQSDQTRCNKGNRTGENENGLKRVLLRPLQRHGSSSAQSYRRFRRRDQ